MSDQQPTTTNSSNWLMRLPQLQSRWWTVLLAFSLMANLLIVGLMLGHRFGGRGADRMPRDQVVQLVPRKFFTELPAERRRELLRVVRGKMREMRNETRRDPELAMKLADVLAQDTLDKASLQQTLGAFMTGPNSAAGRTSAISEELVGLLSTEERKALANAIRERATAGSP